ncbi:MarR family winged helix-turn-helix transcriptional regulator [Actinomadura sp. LOL_016]|uniref:MarR family winged helix-turn-helix transcriptional regulator n=1 Tax=unclassified Actinomadura TaxID=2626254 RepID=UPI003A81159A
MDRQLMADGVGPMGMYHDTVEARYGAGDHYEAALTLMTAARRLTAEIGKVLKEHGLTMPQWSVLTILHLAPAEQIPLGRIAQALEVHGTTITNAIDRLVDIGLVERAVDPADRRSVHAVITPEGADRAEAIMRRLADRQFGLGALSSIDLRALLQLLGKLGPVG